MSAETFIVDASVALKWCLPIDGEPFIMEAEDLLRLFQTGYERFVVPDLFWVELANALWKAVGKQRIDTERAEQGLRAIRDLHITTLPSYDLVPQALQLALAHKRTVYDSIYVCLALRIKANLITADERLANALAARFPIKWLGAL